MKSIILFYIKVFFMMGILFGLLFIPLDLISGKGFELNRFLFNVIAYGGPMSLFLGTIHILGVRHLGINTFTTSVLNVKQKLNVLSKLSIQDLANILKSDTTFKKVSLSENGETVILKTGMSWKSYGENITIHALTQSNFGTEYEIVSKPIVRTILLDYGKNLQNVMRVEKLLSK